MSNLSEIMLDDDDFPEALAFRPERFLNENGEFVPHPKNLPFGYGKRRWAANRAALKNPFLKKPFSFYFCSCLGENLARTQIFYYVTGLVHRFHLEPASEGEEMSEDPLIGVVLTPKPFSIRLTPS